MRTVLEFIQRSIVFFSYLCTMSYFDKLYECSVEVKRWKYRAARTGIC